MIILTNALSARDDEGSLKVARKLIGAIKEKMPNSYLITYENHSPMSDRHLKINKLMLSGKLAATLWKRKEDVLFAPLYVRMHALAAKVCVLSLLARRRLTVLVYMQPRMKKWACRLMKISGARFVFLSQQACENMSAYVPSTWIRAGVDTRRFLPAKPEEKAALRRKYQLPLDKKIVLHVGHMKYGRNVDKLLQVGEEHHVVLVTSQTTKPHEDQTLASMLKEKKNVTVIDWYMPEIQEIYQLADVYFFPVMQDRNCIDAPLSVLEAASCNIPVVCTPYGVLKELMGSDGFFFMEEASPESFLPLLRQAFETKKGPRESVLAYDWQFATESLMKNFCEWEVRA